MTSAGSPAGPTVPTWTPPSTYLDRLGAVESGSPISVTSSPYNVLPGVTGAAATTAGIDAAILAASTRTDGPRAVHFPPGTYTVDLVQDPDGSTIAAGVWNRTGVALLAAPGVTIKLKDAATMPVGCTQAHIVSVLAPFTTISGKLKRDLFIDHLTIDGNAANQTLDAGVPRVAHGLFIGSTEKAWINRCVVKGLRGTASSPPGETMHFEANNSKNVTFTDCEADGQGSITGSGFSADNSFDVVWAHCRGHDMAFGHGFTHWQCAGVRYVACYAYGNAGTGGCGFNSERSEDVQYTGCIAGGRSPLIGNGNPQNPFYTGGQVALANDIGFRSLGSTNVRGNGCTSTYNTTNGLYVGTNTAGSDAARVSANIRFSGSIFLNTVAGAGSNVYIEKSGDFTGAQAQTNVVIDLSDVDASGVTSIVADVPTIQGTSINGTSGLRLAATAYSSWLLRVLYIGGGRGGQIPLAVNGVQQVLTQGRMHGRVAKTANYTITVADEIVGVTDTTAPRTITLPSAATAQAGAYYTIKDESGAAATNNITVARAGSDTIDGATSRVINTNYGSVTLYSDGSSKWLTV